MQRYINFQYEPKKFDKSLSFFDIFNNSRPLCQLLDGIAALFHEPARGASSTTDTYGLDTFEPRGLDLLGILYEVGIRIHTQTLVKEHLAVGTLATTDEEDQIMTGSKLRDVRHAVGNTATDGVKRAEGSLWGDVLLDVLDDTMILVERLRGLGIEVDVA